MKTHILVLTVLAISLSSCASSEIIEEGPDSYMIYREGGAGVRNTGKLKVEAVREAGEYCKKMGKTFRITRSSEKPAVPFSYASTEIGFMCLKEGDAELTRPKMEQMPDTVIQLKK